MIYDLISNKLKLTVRIIHRIPKLQISWYSISTVQ